METEIKSWAKMTKWNSCVTFAARQEKVQWVLIRLSGERVSAGEQLMRKVWTLTLFKVHGIRGALSSTDSLSQGVRRFVMKVLALYCVGPEKHGNSISDVSVLQISFRKSTECKFLEDDPLNLSSTASSHLQTKASDCTKMKVSLKLVSYLWGAQVAAVR